MKARRTRKSALRAARAAAEGAQDGVQDGTGVEEGSGQSDDESEDEEARAREAKLKAKFERFKEHAEKCECFEWNERHDAARQQHAHQLTPRAVAGTRTRWMNRVSITGVRCIARRCFLI